MPIPLQQAQGLLAALQEPQLRTLFAQAHAKHVLHEVNEAAENFPDFDPLLDDKVTFSAYAFLAAGCSIAEQGDRAEGASSIERAASLLFFIHGPHRQTSRESGFHTLVSAMAFYAAGHYSRGFVTIRSVEAQTAAAGIIAQFLRKDVASLIPRLNDVLLRETPSFEDQTDLNEHAITLAIARACAFAVEFTFTGQADALGNADQQLRDAAVVAKSGDHAAWWWIVRLFRLMLADLDHASPWRVLPPFFGSESAELRRYVQLLAFAKQPVTELWTSQRAAFPLALDPSNRGGIINLRTSAGKTRVAELAILQTLLVAPDARILYLAPFRSLALEVEHTLASTFSWLDHDVSHLYGGSRISSVDTELLAESAITIATPEKARALLRAAPEVLERVKLIIVDEGHLIGADERLVRNEVFVDHLRTLANRTNARLLLLSAVLPNPQELAEWVTGTPEAVAASAWKPSAERFGLMRWNGRRVRIEWHGEVASFNPNFVEAEQLGFGKRRKAVPSDKNEAVAATAVRLSAIGPVMIFTGKAVSVPTLAKAVLLAMGEAPPEHPWPTHEWKVFEAVCHEELSADAIELRAARAGVVCHSNRLTSQVRLAIEHLMRSKPPRVIIATTTLGQGVNVGISSVIVSTPYVGKNATIGKRDFWNICGRAGRAFVDGEGKILYAIDDTRSRAKIAQDEELAQSYFDAGVGDRVKSGLLAIVRAFRRVAVEAGVPFELLLEMAANNDFTQLGAVSEAVEHACDLFDDELLALHMDPVVNPDAREPEVWVEQVFRNSLAVLQARADGSEAVGESVLGVLKARARSALNRVPATARRSIVSSGLPLSVAIRANTNVDAFAAVAATCQAEPTPIEQLVAAVRQVEDWVRLNARAIASEMPAAEQLDALRFGWLNGMGLQLLNSIDPDAAAIVKDLYGYQLPWILHAASQNLRNSDQAERADALAKLALLVELGVSSELAARIFLAGVRSRAAATELAALDVAFGQSISQITQKLRDPHFVGHLQTLVSETTATWLELMVADGSRWGRSTIPRFPEFSMAGLENAQLVHVRHTDGQLFLTTTGGELRVEVAASEQFRFDRVANDSRVAFANEHGVWRMVIRDPRAALTSE